MFVRDYLAHNARSWPDRPAYVSATRRQTWGEVAERSQRLAAALQTLGVEKGEAIATLATDSHEVVEAWYAASTVGAVRVGINFRYSAAEIAHILEDAQVKVLIVQGVCEDAFRSIPQAVRDSITVIGFGSHGFDLDYETLLAGEDPLPHWVELSPDDCIAISYTTGSTGVPKGAVWSHGAVVAAELHTWLQAGGRHDDIFLHCLPAAGVPILLATWNVFSGATVVLMDRFSARGALEAIQQERVTSVLWVPTMMIDVLNDPDIESFDLSSLRLVLYGSAPASPALVRKALETFGCELQQWYGSTEGAAGWYTILHHADHLEALRDRPELLSSCGRPTLHTQLAVHGPDDEDLPAGEVGEICVRGEFVMAGYLRREAETARTLAGGWLHTGDMGRLDPSGYLYLVDRKDFMIISGGYNVYPVVVENVLSDHPGVKAVSVFGIPDERWGEAVLAVVVPSGAVTTDELLDHCRSRLGRFEVPKRIELVDQLPRGATGKVLKRALRDRYRATGQPG